MTLISDLRISEHSVYVYRSDQAGGEALRTHHQQFYIHLKNVDNEWCLNLLQTQ